MRPRRSRSTLGLALALAAALMIGSLALVASPAAAADELQSRVSGQGVTIGQADPNTVWSTDKQTWAPAYVVGDRFSHPWDWDQVAPEANWINCAPSFTACLNETVWYRTFIVLPNRPDLQLSFRVIADNAATPYINGVQAGDRFETTGSVQIDPTLLHPGINTFDMRFEDWGGLTGFRWQLFGTLDATQNPDANQDGVPDVTRTPWQMLIPPAPAGNLGFQLPFHGHESAYDLAVVPAQDASGWQNAPDGNTVGFDGRVPGFGGDNASRLAGYPCLGAVDYTYFQTIVDVPPGTSVNQFSVNFNGIDDGARISIYNSANPTGVVVPGSYVYLGGSGTTNLAGYMVTGSNRVVITQVDDCWSGNNLREASIVLNNAVVPAPQPPPNTPPTVAVTGVTQGASYQFGQVSASGCTADDAEDGTLSATKTTSAVTGPQAGIGLGSQTVTCTATDSKGASTSAAVTYSIVDTGKPTISAAVTAGPNGSNGWYTGNVIVHFTCADSGVGLAPGACPADEVLTGEGAAVSSTAKTVTDRAGNVSDPSNVVTVKIDRTNPSASATAATTPNGNGWYNDDVVVGFTCADAAGGSGVASCPSDQVLTGEGPAVSSTAGTATDKAGRVSAPSNVVTVKIDRTKPVVTAAVTTPPNANGWYNGNVVVEFTCTDAAGGSGVTSCPADQVLTGEGAAVSSTAVTITDKAGNTSAASNVVTVKIDRTKPVVAFSGATSYGLLDTVDITCSATDALSGIASSTCASTTGAAWSFGPGVHTRTASALDKAGNSGSGSTSFRVTATASSLCSLVHAFTDHNGTRTSLCAHLTNFQRSSSRGQAGPAAAQLEAFRKEAASRSGKQLTAYEVAVLIGWANTL